MNALRLALITVAVCLLSLTAPAQAPADTYPDGIPKAVDLPSQSWSNHKAKLRIVLAAASTVQDSSGWGTGFKDSLKPDVECLNLSKGERSTRTYREEGRWDQAIALKPDYIFIGFANNDAAKNRPQRYVTPEDFRINTVRFVTEARAAGIKPILMTTMSAHRWKPDGTLKDMGQIEPYDQMVRDIAAEMNVPLFDVEKISFAFFTAAGEAKVNTLSPVKDGVLEGQHLNKYGGMVVGKVMAETLKTQVPELAPYIK